MTYLILQAMSPGLCSIISAVTINAAAFDVIAANPNKELWDGTYKTGHLGELILQRLPNVQRVQITAPSKDCCYGISGYSPNDTCTEKRFRMCYDCAEFFWGQLDRGRIEKVEFIIERKVSQLTTEKDVSSTDPAYLYWAASRGPWSPLKISKTFTDRCMEYLGWDEREGPLLTSTSRTWIVTYERGEGNGH
jgi:hypothetical protein